MINGVGPNPFADPISFFIFYYLFNVSGEGFVALLKLALMSSVLAFPFALLADRLYPRLVERVKTRPLVLMYATALVTCAVFWAVMLLWQLAAGRGIAGDVVLPLLGSSVVAFVFGLFGNYALAKMRAFWQLPRTLGVYLAGLVTCIVFWLVIWLYSMLAPALY